MKEQILILLYLMISCESGVAATKHEKVLCEKLLSHVDELANYSRSLGEYFDLGKKHRIAVAEVYDFIAFGKLDFTAEERPIAGYVEKHLTPNSSYLVTDIKPDHVARIDKPRLSMPGIIVKRGNHEIIIDGNHRAVRRHQEGYDTMNFFVVYYEDLVDLELVGR